MQECQIERTITEDKSLHGSAQARDETLATGLKTHLNAIVLSSLQSATLTLPIGGARFLDCK